MKRVMIGWVALALLVLSGCAQLRVGVDVLDREYVRAEAVEEGLRQTYRRVAAAQPGELANEINRNLEDYRREVGTLADRYDALASKLKSEYQSDIKEVADGLRNSVQGGTPVARAKRKAEELEKLAREIRQQVAQRPWSGRGVIPVGIRNKLVAFETASKQYDHDLSLERRALSIDAKRIEKLVSRTVSSSGANVTESADFKAAKQQQAVVAAVAQRSLIEGAELTHTEFAYIVASAPDKLWFPNYNQAAGSGTFGNVDIVIKMNSTADFSVKGMRFDATTVATVASKVTTQAVLLGAQMAGVPVTTASTGTTTGGDALSKSSADLAAGEAALAKRQALSDAQRSAIRAAARTILGARAQLEERAFKKQPVADRAPLHDSIDSTLSALRPLISMQDLQ